EDAVARAAQPHRVLADVDLQARGVPGDAERGQRVGGAAVVGRRGEQEVARPVGERDQVLLPGDPPGRAVAYGAGVQIAAGAAGPLGPRGRHGRLPAGRLWHEGPLLGVTEAGERSPEAVADVGEHPYPGRSLRRELEVRLVVRRRQ